MAAIRTREIRFIVGILFDSCLFGFAKIAYETDKSKGEDAKKRLFVLYFIYTL